MYTRETAAIVQTIVNNCRCLSSVCLLAKNKKPVNFICCDLFPCDFSFFSAERLKEKCFVLSQIKLQRIVFPHIKNEFDRVTGSYEESPSKIVLLVAVALYRQPPCSDSKAHTFFYDRPYKLL